MGRCTPHCLYLPTAAPLCLPCDSTSFKALKRASKTRKMQHQLPMLRDRNIPPDRNVKQSSQMPGSIAEIAVHNGATLPQGSVHTLDARDTVTMALRHARLHPPSMMRFWAARPQILHLGKTKAADVYHTSCSWRACGVAAAKVVGGARRGLSRCQR
jgi:hypothetical protein